MDENIISLVTFELASIRNAFILFLDAMMCVRVVMLGSGNHPILGPVSQSLLSMTNDKISDKSADNQSESRIQ